MKARISASLFFVALSLVLACKEKKDKPSLIDQTFELRSPLGKTLRAPQASKKAITQYEIAKANFEKDPENADIHIWYGRRTAYLARYSEAIAIYSDGIKKFPTDARFYRHRGHRYISVRNFDAAIEDLEMAKSLVKDSENIVEPDGIPNALNIPISTLHGNIYYHLGLAYYLKHDYQKAFEAFLACRNTGNNDDNIVSSTHWLFMIQERLEDHEAAKKMLAPIHDSLQIIENTDYYKLCKFYKGLLRKDSLKTGSKGASSDALNYGLANWYFNKGEKELAKRMYDSIIKANTWNSFGYIATESDLLTYYQN